MVELTTTPLDPQAIVSRLKKDSYGAVITFLGIVRDSFQGKKVYALEYEAHPEMAEKKLRQIEREVGERWGVKDIAISHRLGRLGVGETSLVIAVASPHRQEAFAACQYAVDRLKEIVPIWKKEYREDGSYWLGPGAGEGDA